MAWLTKEEVRAIPTSDVRDAIVAALQDKSSRDNNFIVHDVAEKLGVAVLVKRGSARPKKEA